jgi:hypothetical protein
MFGGPLPLNPLLQLAESKVIKEDEIIEKI